MLKHRKQSGRYRKGITITEALASIAVAATGLFAVFAVIPFAARQSEVGLDIDTAVTVGKDAVQDFDVRGMGNYGNWRMSFLVGTGNNVPMPAANWNNQTVLIDPLYVNNNFALIADPPANPEISQFPYPLFNLANPNDTIPRLNLAANDLAYDFAHSAQIFQTVNDLVFDEPADKLELPPQRFQLQGGVGVKRSYNGKISWMAMVVPQNGHPHLYRLYVIVFKKRALNYLASDPAGEAVYNATLVNPVPVVPAPVPPTFISNAGGEFQFDLLPGTPQSNQLLKDDYLNNGDWVLLTDHSQVHGATNNWRWYRVNRVNPPGAGSRNSAQVSLVGPDWVGRDVDPATAGVQARAIVLSNVLGVYEKTVRIEYDSIWNE